LFTDDQLETFNSKSLAQIAHRTTNTYNGILMQSHSLVYVMT